MSVVSAAEDGRLRAATEADRGGAIALAAVALPFDITDGPFRAMDAADLIGACWDPTEADGSPARTVTRRVSEARVGILPGPGGVPVPVPAGIATGSLAPGADGEGPVGHVHLVAVHPDARGRGLGRRLLDAVSDDLRAAGATSLSTTGRPPRFGWPGPDVRYTAFGLLAGAAGFERGESATNMTVNLDAASRTGRLDTAADLARLAAAGVAVRRATAQDGPAIATAAAEFGGTWAVEAAMSLARDPVAVHVALRGERVVGFACHATSRHGWFGPIGVSASERLGGIGAVLLRRCLVDVRAEGRAEAQICWVGPVRFYARAVDAYVDRTFATYRKPL